MKLGSLASLAGRSARAARSVAVSDEWPSAGVQQARPWTAMAESIAIGLLLPALGLLVNRRDPFFETRSFSWVVLPPLLAALRHGFAAGCASAAALGASMIVGWRLHVFGTATFPGEALIGMLTAAMVTGQMSDVWLRGTVRTRLAFDHASRRANEFARAHLLLQLSHERLQEQSPGIASLHDALERIAAQESTGLATWKALAPQFLSLAARFGSVEKATLVQVDAGGALGMKLDKLGDPSPVQADDPMVRDAVRSGQIACVGGGDVAAGVVRYPEGTSLLAVIPAADSTGKLHAVLCVQTLPFFALTRLTLESLALLAGHFADRVASGGRPLSPAREQQKVFEEQIGRAIKDCRERSTPAVLGILAVRGGSPFASITDLVLAGILEPTHFAHRTRVGQRDWLIWLLLPSAGEPEVRALVARIEDLTSQELQRTMGEAGGTAAFRFLRGLDQPWAVMAALERDLDTRRGR